MAKPLFEHPVALLVWFRPYNISIDRVIPESTVTNSTGLEFYRFRIFISKSIHPTSILPSGTPLRLLSRLAKNRMIGNISS